MIRERSPQSIDAAKIARNRELQQRASWRARQQAWCQDELQHCALVDDPATSPANTYRQLGRVWSPSQLAAAVARLNSSVAITTIPAAQRGSLAEKRRAVTWYRSSGPHIVCYCEAGFMPEHSIMECREDVTPFLGSHMEPDTPAYFPVRKPGRELVRGWRTVLIRLVLAGATTATDVERLVGSSSRAAWQQHLGKSFNHVPF